MGVGDYGAQGVLRQLYRQIVAVLELKRFLESFYPDMEIGQPHEEMYSIIEKYGKVRQTPIARSDKARNTLGLSTMPIEETLKATCESLISLGLVKPIAK